MSNETRTTDRPRELTTITVSREFAKKVKTIADHRDETMADTLDRVADSPITREYRKTLDEMIGKVTGGEGG